MNILSFTVSMTAMILLPVALAVWLRRRYVVAWFLFCVGMATFIGAQVYHIPLNEWLANVGLIGPMSKDAPDFWRTAVILGLSAGLCETVARVLGYAILFRYHKAENFEDGVMVGLGHGGIEAMIIGGVLTAASLTALLSLQDVDLSTLGMTAEQMTAVATQLNALQTTPLVAFVALLERAAAIALQVVLSVLVWLAFKRRQPLYVLAAILYHALVDATAVYAVQFIQNAWLLEGILWLLVLPGLLWLWRVWPRGERSPRLLNSPRTDLVLWGTAVTKELRQQWRTRQLLIVCAVLLVFGLTSLLLAKFTPELLKSIEGAEQFASLIPEPTTADAISQYIKNLTQFGFILVIILGMGAVAGEKDKGVATMILSKPMTRWAFLLSKFTAQSFMYLLAILLGALGAYYYTAVLFGGLELGPFLLGNVLLWLWLLVFAAVTLLSSTIARTTGAAAGIALLGSVLLFLLGSLPQISQIMPAALVSWAGQLGLQGDIPANGGALVMAIVLIIASLITAVAIFEQQEL
jgi:ABC-2 type transport system permease protein